MRTIIIAFVLTFFSSNIIAQKKSAELKSLQYQIDSIKSYLKLHVDHVNYDDILLNKIRSRLALELNRNFVYFGEFYETDPETNSDTGYQRVFCFIGYQSKEKYGDQYKNDKGAYLKLVRDYVHIISEIIADGESDFVDPNSSYILYANRAKIIFYDNADSSESIFEADSFTKSIKVRIDGVLQEINWN